MHVFFIFSRIVRTAAKTAFISRAVDPSFYSSVLKVPLASYVASSREWRV